VPCLVKVLNGKWASDSKKAKKHLIWLVLIILATWEAEIRRIKLPGQPAVRRPHIKKNEPFFFFF
jgi:hypothetical protein